MDFNTVRHFEQKISDFFGSPFAVATDSCTHGIELCLRYTNAQKATCPSRTYISIPFTFEKLGLDWNFCNDRWQDYYYITPKIIDAAVLWRENSFIENTLMCISFQFKKHLSLGRGGAILCSNYTEWLALKKLSYDGRDPYTAWSKQNIDSIGYHYYMTPETAKKGLKLLPDAIQKEPRLWSYKDYPMLDRMRVFNEFKK